MKKAFCENCGSKIEDGAHFCSVCGCKFENDDEVIENFADISSQTDITLIEEIPAAEKTENIIKTAPQEIAALKKPAYKFEKFLLIISAICAVCSLAFYFVVTNFGGIPMVNKLEESEPDIPVLTADMAEEIINNSAWCFPYYYFQERDMLNTDDYIIHPYSEGSGYEVKCYTADGIYSMEDYYKCFDKYATRDFIESHFNQEHFFILENSKLYFVPNEWMGWYPTSAEDIIIEKIDDETYYTTTSFWTGDEFVIKYIDGNFKVTSLTPKEAYAAYNNASNTVEIPNITEMSIDEAEAELKKAGLTLDRDNITYVFNYFFHKDGTVLAAKNRYKKVTPGSAIGIYVAVEDPETYG